MEHINIDSKPYIGHKIDLTWMLRTKTGQDVFWKKICATVTKREIYLEKKYTQMEKEQNLFVAFIVF